MFLKETDVVGEIFSFYVKWKCNGPLSIMSFACGPGDILYDLGVRVPYGLGISM